MKKISAIGFALLMIFAVFVPAVAALNDPTKVGYQSVVNPNVLGERSPENIGHLDVLLACRAPQIGGEFTIVPVTVSAPFTNAARVDKGFVDQFVKQFGEPKTEQYLPDGTFDANYAPGTYLLKQIDGNGGQPEFALVAIKAADSQTVVFLGHGITPASEEQKKIVITVTQATYGATRVVVDVPAHDHTVVDHAAYYEHSHDHATTTVPCTHIVPAVPAVTHQVTVVDTPAVPAHPEHAFDTQTTQVPCTHIVPAVPAVTHQVTVVDTPAQPAVYRQGTPCSSYTSGHVHANQVTGNADATNRFVYDGHVYQEIGNGGQTFKVTGTYTPAVAEVSHQETVVDVPAIPAHPEHAFDTQTTQVPCTHIVPEVPAVTHQETVVDVPAVPAHPQHPAGDSATTNVPCVHYHPAQTHVVHHAAQTHVEGAVVDVKAKVQAVLDAGTQTFKFDNAQNPGGIFSTDNVLLQQIADPAFGQLKNVHIVYTVDGGAPKTVDAQEYQSITLE